MYFISIVESTFVHPYGHDTYGILPRLLIDPSALARCSIKRRLPTMTLSLIDLEDKLKSTKPKSMLINGRNCQRRKEITYPLHAKTLIGACLPMYILLTLLFILVYFIFSFFTSLIFLHLASTKVALPPNQKSHSCNGNIEASFSLCLILFLFFTCHVAFCPQVLIMYRLI